MMVQINPEMIWVDIFLVIPCLSWGNLGVYNTHGGVWFVFFFIPDFRLGNHQRSLILLEAKHK